MNTTPRIHATLIALLALLSAAALLPMVAAQSRQERDATRSLPAAQTSLISHRLYMALVRKNYPPIPAAPAIQPIDNGDGDDAYCVDWSPAERATSYTLHEDDNPQFSSPATVYSGRQTRACFSGKAPGTRFYRVRGRNAWGEGPWSQTVSVVVPSPWGIWVIQNDTGGDLTVEVVGYQTATWPPGRHEWRLPVGTHTVKVSAWCGSLTDSITILPYQVSVETRYYCQTSAGVSRLAR